MKKITFSIAMMALAMNAMANDNKPKTPAKHAAKAPAAETLKLDVAASKAVWTGKKVTGSHTGTVEFKDGEFQFKKGKLAGGEVEINLASIKNDDVKDAEYNKKLVDHLKSPDFFNVEKNPIAKFKIKSMNEIHNFVPGQPNLEAKGELTINGITKPSSVKLIYTPSETGFDAKGKVMIDRTQYGLKYNSKKFFDVKSLGDKMIDDTFEVDLTLVAKK